MKYSQWPVASINPRTFWMVLCCTLLVACNTVRVNTNETEPVKQIITEINEAELLDVGIVLFDPGFEGLEKDKYLVSTPEIRMSESRYFAEQLSEVLIHTSAWGSVRIVPPETSFFDLTVKGNILRSDGEMLHVLVEARDASNRLWFNKEYKETASKFSYEKKENKGKEPFQNVFNRIANDLLAHRKQFSSSELTRLRSIAEMRFANSFAPQVFSDYLQTDKKGEIQLARLPDEQDPFVGKIRAIRERDYLFVDTLQDHYQLFLRSVSPSYQEWRRASYYEVVALNETRRKARNNIISGVVTVLAGVAAANSNSGAVKTAGAVAASAGGFLVLRGLNQRADVDIHIDSLKELADSLQSEVEPLVFELENRTVTLTGSVENQYQQWRELLKELFEQEQGLGPQAAN